MRYVLPVVVLSLALVLACSKPAPPLPARAEVVAYTMDPEKGLGPIAFSAPGAAVEGVFGPPEQALVKTAREYVSYGVAFLFDQQDSVAQILFGNMNGSLEDPLVKACLFKTTEGIGMGSARNDVVTAYGAPTRVHVNGHYETMEYPDKNASFTLHDDRVVHMAFSRKKR